MTVSSRALLPLLLIIGGSIKKTYDYYSDLQTDHIVYQELPEPINPSTTILVFDMHKVFKEQNHFIISCHLLANHWRAILGFLCSPQTWSPVKATIKDATAKTKCGEQIFTLLEEKHPQFAGMTETLQESFLKHKIIPATVASIKELKEKGYTLYVLSNCRHDTFDQELKQNPVLFKLFSGAYLPFPENNFNCKPKNSFYQSFKAYLAQQGHANKQIVFIDDKLKNITSALPHGISGIHFVSALQLRKDIARLEQGLA